MKLSEIKSLLPSIESITFRLPSGAFVPAHAHITELGIITRHFIDCGGTLRTDQKINFQLWTADDYDHRLSSAKMQQIIAAAEAVLPVADLDIEVEWQRDTIGMYTLDWDGSTFILNNTQTACLAEDACGIPQQNTKRSLHVLTVNQGNCCTPDSGCC